MKSNKSHSNCLPPGEYTVIVAFAEQLEANSGKIQLRLRSITGGPLFIENLDGSSEDVWAFCALGLRFEDYMADGWDVKEMKGRTGRALIDIVRVGGRDYNKIRQWL